MNFLGMFLIVALLVNTRCTSIRAVRQIAATGDEFSSLALGGRHSLHGMVVFGKGQYFIDHIPMLRQPHDFQIVAAVTIVDKNGNPLVHDFSQKAFTIRPDPFSLNDYLAGRLTSFEADVFEGSFEVARPVEVAGLKRVKVTVSEFKIRRHLPGESLDERVKLSDGVLTYEANIITPLRNHQAIFANGRRIWCVVGNDFVEPCS